MIAKEERRLSTGRAACKWLSDRLPCLQHGWRAPQMAVFPSCHPVYLVLWLSLSLFLLFLPIYVPNCGTNEHIASPSWTSEAGLFLGSVTFAPSGMSRERHLFTRPPGNLTQKLSCSKNFPVSFSPDVLPIEHLVNTWLWHLSRLFPFTPFLSFLRNSRTSGNLNAHHNVYKVIFASENLRNTGRQETPFRFAMGYYICLGLWMSMSTFGNKKELCLLSTWVKGFYFFNLAISIQPKL